MEKVPFYYTLIHYIILMDKVTCNKWVQSDSVHESLFESDIPRFFASGSPYIFSLLTVSATAK